jgi:alkylation response protein AidB-like acyl-CoA dehydrogenase
MPGTLEARIREFEDYRSITELKARYCNAVDGGWGKPANDAEAVIALFVEEGVWEVTPHGPAGKGHVGIRAAIEQFAAVPFIIHNVMNPLIRIEGDTATGQWHACFCMSEPSNPSAYALSFAIYEDAFVRTATGWKFKALRVTPAASVPLASRP